MTNNEGIFLGTFQLENNQLLWKQNQNCLVMVRQQRCIVCQLKVYLRKSQCKTSKSQYLKFDLFNILFMLGQTYVTLDELSQQLQNATLSLVGISQWLENDSTAGHLFRGSPVGHHCHQPFIRPTYHSLPRQRSGWSLTDLTKGKVRENHNHSFASSSSTSATAAVCCRFDEMAV